MSKAINAINHVINNPFSNEVNKDIEITDSQAKKLQNGRANKSYWFVSMMLKTFSVVGTALFINHMFTLIAPNMAYLGYLIGFIIGLGLEIATKEFFSLVALYGFFTGNNKDMSTKDLVTKKKNNLGGVAIILLNLLTVIGGYYTSIDLAYTSYLKHSPTHQQLTKEALKELNQASTHLEVLQAQSTQSNKVGMDTKNELLAIKRGELQTKINLKFDSQEIDAKQIRDTSIQEANKLSDKYRTKRSNLIQDAKETYTETMDTISIKRSRALSEAKTRMFNVSTELETRVNKSNSKLENEITKAKQIKEELETKYKLTTGESGFISTPFLIIAIVVTFGAFLIQMAIDVAEAHNRLESKGIERVREKIEEKQNNTSSPYKPKISLSKDHQNYSYLESRNDDKKPFNYNGFEGKTELEKSIGFIAPKASLNQDENIEDITVKNKLFQDENIEVNSLSKLSQKEIKVLEFYLNFFNENNKLPIVADTVKVLEISTRDISAINSVLAEYGFIEKVGAKYLPTDKFMKI